LTELSKQEPTVKFTIEKELQNSINFLGLSIHHKKKMLEFAIYRKPTLTDIIIPNDSLHPHEHKISRIDYLVNRLNAYPIPKEAKEKGLNIIKDTLHNNDCNITKIKKHPA
jgi:hypothetical protein